MGKIYKNIRYPVYDEEENISNTASGLVFVLTHECDIDSNNNRLFNTEILINPIIDFISFIDEQAKYSDDNSLKGFISSLSEGKVSRVVYLPPITKEYLPYGGLMYLNHICSTHISSFGLEGAETVCAVTAPALDIIDKFLQNHFLRPKADRLAFG